MKVEYLPGASRIRIMDFNREELRKLRRTFVRLARGALSLALIFTRPFVSHCLQMHERHFILGSIQRLFY
jgi:hypothetical protein